MVMLLEMCSVLKSNLLDKSKGVIAGGRVRCHCRSRCGLRSRMWGN